jgi:hypothetical protein
MIAPLLLLIVCTFTTANAVAIEQANISNTQTANPPDAELLEYIAGFESVGGVWIDPMHFYDSFETGDKAKENDHE